MGPRKQAITVWQHVSVGKIYIDVIVDYADTVTALATTTQTVIFWRKEPKNRF